jgi:AraC-like DNA-binding protein
MPDKSLSSAVAITYKGVGQGQNYEMWREELCRRFCRLDVEPSTGTGIDCQIALASLSHLVLATAAGVSGRFSRTRDLLPDGCDDFVLVSATGGPVHVIQNGRTIALSRSEMCLTEMSGPCSIGFNGNEHFTTIRIPRRALLEMCPRAEERLSRSLHENSTLQAMIARYHALSSELAQSLDSVAQRMTAQHLVDLIGLLLGAGHEEEELATQRGYSAVRLELMKTDVLNNLDRSDLNIGSIARAYGLSPRHAQRLFAQTGITFTEFLLEQRLLLARRLLGEAHHRHRKISTIAHEAGFGDLSYFNRMFRKRFGAAPSDTRAAVRANGRS